MRYDNYRSELIVNRDEIVSARKGEVDLATKIGKIDSSLSEKAKQTDLATINSNIANNSTSITSLQTLKAEKTEVIAVSSRVDNIIANNGSGTKDTELIDARTGTDGTIYASAKARLDAEYNKAKYKVIAKTGITNTSPITAFPSSCISSTVIALADNAGFPTGDGTLETNRIDTNNQLHFQTWYDVVTPDTYRRTYYGNAWKPWSKIDGSFRTIPKTEITNASPITSFPSGCVSSTSFLTTDNAGFPTGDGTLETNRIGSSTELHFQTWYDCSTTDVYRRTYYQLTWKPWNKISVNSEGKQSKKAGDVTTGYTYNPSQLNFVTRKVDQGTEQRINAFRYSFFSNPNSAGANILTEVTGSTNISYSIYKGGMYFTSTDEVKNNKLYKTPTKMSFGRFCLELEVSQMDETGTEVSVGMVKDSLNYVLFNYSKALGSFEIYAVVDGVKHSLGTGTYVSHIAPFKIKLYFYVGYITGIIETSDGEIIQIIREVKLQQYINFTDATILNSYSPGFGVTITSSTKHIKLKGFSAYYSNGKNLGANFRTICYEDASPIRDREGNIYIMCSATAPNGIGAYQGMSIYKFRPPFGEHTYIGTLCARYNNKILSGNSDDLFFDRNTSEWIYTPICIDSSFGSAQAGTLIGKTKENLLGGVHIVDVQLMNLPTISKTRGVYDLDIMYHDGLYHACYTEHGSPYMTTKTATATNVLGVWTETSARVNDVSNQYDEGNCWTKIGGVYYFTQSHHNEELIFCDENTSEIKYKMNVDWWCSTTAPAPSPWGCIIPIVEGTTTSYIAMIHASDLLFSENGFSYGTCIVYQANEIQPAQEFETGGMTYFNGM